VGSCVLPDVDQFVTEGGGEPEECDGGLANSRPATLPHPHSDRLLAPEHPWSSSNA
jgi:hypothetical protein